MKKTQKVQKEIEAKCIASGKHRIGMPNCFKFCGTRDCPYNPTKYVRFDE